MSAAGQLSVSGSCLSVCVSVSGKVGPMGPASTLPRRPCPWAVANGLDQGLHTEGGLQAATFWDERSRNPFRAPTRSCSSCPSPLTPQVSSLSVQPTPTLTGSFLSITYASTNAHCCVRACARAPAGELGRGAPRSLASAAAWPRFPSWHGHALVARPWTGHVTSQKLSVLPCEMGE